MRTTLPLLLLVSGCVLGRDQYPTTSDLEEDWDASRLRVLGIAAEPPELAPGESTGFSLLLADPQDQMGEEGTVVWAACTEDEVLPIGCFPDFETFSNVIGVQPGLEPTYTAPDDLLDDLDEYDAREGVYVYVTAMVVPEELVSSLLSGDSIDTGDVDYSLVKIATKLVVVSRATTPNDNPVLESFTADGLDVPAGSVLQVDADQPYELGVLIHEDAVETYEYLNTDGETEDREEEPYVQWYADVGDLQEDTTLYPNTQADWIAPAAGESGTIYAVARDRRGGMAWWTQRIEAR